MKVENETLVIEIPKYKLSVDDGRFFIIDETIPKVVVYVDTKEKQMADLTGDKPIINIYGE